MNHNTKKRRFLKLSVNFVFVKLFAAILSIYILLMVCKPYVDGAIISHSQKELAAAENHSHDSTDDACSPFCICSCCSVQIVLFTQPIIYHLQSASAFIQIRTPTYNSIFISDFFENIWQPPQIA